MEGQVSFSCMIEGSIMNLHPVLKPISQVRKRTKPGQKVRIDSLYLKESPVSAHQPTKYVCGVCLNTYVH